MENQTPQVVTIAGSDSGGGAGVQADLKTFQARNVFGTSILVALTAQNTRGVQESCPVACSFVDAQFASLDVDFHIRAAKTGMLFDQEHVQTVVNNYKKFAALMSPTISPDSHYWYINLSKYERIITMKKFITFIVILVCIFPIGKILLNTIPNNHNKNQESSIDKTNPQPSSSKENENSSTPTDNFVDINKDECNENILVDVGDNEYLVAVDSASKELIINENISDSNKYIKIDYKEILPVISNIEDYKNLSIPQYISLYNKVSPHIDTNMSYSELLSLASSININDLKSNYNEFIKIQKNND